MKLPLKLALKLPKNAHKVAHKNIFLINFLGFLVCLQAETVLGCMFFQQIEKPMDDKAYEFKI